MKKKHHYYSDSTPDNDNTTACGRNGCKVGGFIGFFFRHIKQSERCKICNKQFIKDEQNRMSKWST